MNPDFRDIVAELTRAEARFLIVGAHALSVYGVARATADLDIWIDNSAPNVERVWRALVAFGAPLKALGLAPSDLTQSDIVAQFGLPPFRIDLLTGISGVHFNDAWPDRTIADFEGIATPFIGRAALVRNKQATARPKDLADLDALGEA